MIKNLLLLCALSASASFNAQALAADDLKTGLDLYKQGKFQLAVSYLSAAARGAYSTSAAAHYYLANALVRTNRVNAALKEYREAARLDPNGAYGKTALSFIQKQESKPAGVAEVDREAVKTTERLDVSTEAGVVSKLPRLPVFQPEPVQASVVFLWTPADLAAYVQRAQARLDRARQNVEEAQAVLRKAESISYSLLPSVKSFGESEDHLNERRLTARRRIDELLVPYQKAVEERQRLLAEENKLYDRCVVCYRNIYGYAPVLIH